MADSNIKILRSTDAGAPTLSGTNGALVAVLDACLVNGYNTKTVQSIVRVGTTATVNFATAHGFAADGLTRIALSGATPSEYNGDYAITNVSTLAFDITITVPDTLATPATGTIIAKVAPLGFEKRFSGTNKAVYRSTDLLSTRLNLRVNDAGPFPSGGKTASFIGYETMTDVDVGVGPFPTTLQLANGCCINKSDVASSAVRPWQIIGDGRRFYLLVAAFNTYPSIFDGHFFGDIVSEMSSDPYGCAIMGGSSDINASYPGNNSYFTAINVTSAGAATENGQFIARGYAQVGGSILFGKLSTSLAGATYFGNSGPGYPSPHNNSLYMAPVSMVTGNLLRGALPGLYNPLHNNTIGLWTVINAAQSPIGKKLYSARLAYSNGNYGEGLFDIEGPWSP